MQFRVPQFIDVEDKIFGPLTLKQFAYILGAGGFAFIIWTFISIKIIAVILIIPFSGLFLSFAFLKVNGRPSIDVLEHAVKYVTNAKIYTWKQPTAETSVIKNTTRSEKAVADISRDLLTKKISDSRLHDLSFGLDVLDRSSQEKE